MPVFPDGHVFSQLEETLEDWDYESSTLTLGDPTTPEVASNILLGGKAILKPYHLVWGITMDPHATAPEDLSINTYGHPWPDFLLKFLKSNLDNVSTEEDLVAQLEVRQMPPLQVNSEELVPYFDLQNIPLQHHHLFRDPESLFAFSSLAFMRTPMTRDILKVLPDYLFSWQGDVPILQWIDFSIHPEVGPLQKHLIAQIKNRHHHKLPSLVLTSANISKITPESVSPETALQFWNNGAGLRRKLMPLVIFPTQDFYNKSTNSTYTRIGSYPIIEFGPNGVLSHREGNIPLVIQQQLFSGLGLEFPEDLKMHNYPHISEDQIDPEVVEFISSGYPLSDKVMYLHFLSVGVSPKEAVTMIINNMPWS